MINRRSFLKGAAFGAASLLLPFGRRDARGHIGMPAGLSSPPLTRFKDPFKLPVLLKPKTKGNADFYTITMKESVAQFHSDIQQTTIWGYNGTFPGPMIRAKRNRKVVVRQINNLPMSGHNMPGMPMEAEPAIHLHGAHVPPTEDGHPFDSIPVGEFRDYHYNNEQQGTLMWFHDHAHMMTGAHVYKGLAGLYLLKDPLEAILRLPSGPYEVPLVLQDRVFNNNWSFYYSTDSATLQAGMLGDIYLVNGVAFPHMKVDARKYRFRVLNGSNSRLYGLALSTGEPLVQIGTDGGLLQRPAAHATIDLWPSERGDIIIDFSKYPEGTHVFLRNVYEIDEMEHIMRFDVGKKVKDTSEVPEFLAPWQEIPEAESVITRDFLLERKNINGEFVWTINGQAYDHMNPPLAKPKLGTVEKWRFRNPTNHPHPVHLHLVQFQIVNIDGKPVEPSDYGWKDTMVVRENGGEITLIARFDGFTGKYVFHCHNLEHEDYAMMGEFEVIP
jgi:spore coat protein A